MNGVKGQTGVEGSWVLMNRCVGNTTGAEKIWYSGLFFHFPQGVAPKKTSGGIRRDDVQ